MQSRIEVSCMKKEKSHNLFLFLLNKTIVKKKFHFKNIFPTKICVRSVKKKFNLSRENKCGKLKEKREIKMLNEVKSAENARALEC